MEQMLQKLPIGLQSFERLRCDGYFYIDKTAHVYRLVEEGKYYFLSRPRRFGKSILLSTLKAYFEGKRQLFEGLAISELEKDWLEYPILHIDLNTEVYDTKEKLEWKLENFLSAAEKLYGRETTERTIPTRFEGIIQRAYQKTGRGVVILVDEYDKPLLQAIGNNDLQNAYRATLKGFYGALKSQDACIKFAFLTGVTKFGKVSVFSDLNNLRDISMLKKYHDVCGITEEELLTCFSANIDSLADECGITREQCIEKLRERYDGYRFHQNANGLYNPFSVLNTFASNEFGSYWFETGTPSYLVELLQKYDYNLDLMEHSRVEADVLNSVDVDSSNPIPVIYQSGYLTIKSYDEQFGRYLLGFPNKEVAEGFVKYLAPYYLNKLHTKAAFDIANFIEDVRGGQPEQFCKRLKSLFADTPYELVQNLENHYQNIVWVMFKLMGFHVQAEYHTSDGRIDLVLQTPKYCYVIEFKLDGSAEEALQQIKDKSYTLPFEQNGQHIFRIGMNFSNATRNIENYVIE